MRKTLFIKNMNIEITLYEALQRASTGLRAKMQHSVELLRKAEKIAKVYDPQDGFYLAFSGGKDSQALIHMAQLAGVQFKAHFSPTSVDPPAVIKFIRTQYPEVEFGRLKQSIYADAIKKGILPTRTVRYCCNDFKENTGAGKVTLLGIRKAESVNRAKRSEVEITGKKFSGDLEKLDEYRKSVIEKKSKQKNRQKSPNLANQELIDKESISGCISGKDSLLVSPIIYWTAKDVWEFLNNVVCVPHCKLYDEGWHRLGCICCPKSSAKQKLRELAIYPHVKRNWIKAIMTIRRNGISPDDINKERKDNDLGYIAHPKAEHWLGNRGGQLTPNYLDRSHPFLLVLRRSALRRTESLKSLKTSLTGGSQAKVINDGMQRSLWMVV